MRTALIPLALVNLGVRRFEDYIRTKFPDELDSATAEIPDDAMQEPPLNIAGPVMQGLTFTHESEELRKLFLALLATSMDSRKSATAHPAFAEVISQLESTEASILAAILNAAPAHIAAVAFARRSEDGDGRVVFDHHCIPVTLNGAPYTDPRLGAYIDNWIRLGLIDVDFRTVLTSEGRYEWAEEWPPTVEHLAHLGDSLEIQRGMLRVTSWGTDFARAIDARSALVGGFAVIAPTLPAVAAPGPNASAVIIDGGTA